MVAEAVGASMNDLPVVDLSGPKEKVAKQIHDACVKFGFLYVTGHGVSDDIINGHHAASRAFFSLPLAQKMHVLADANNRGYTPAREETLDPGNQTTGDTKEGLYFGREVAATSQEASLPLHGPNQWPDEDLVPGFRSAMEAYMEAMAQLGKQLVQLLALGLGLPESWFDDKFSKPMMFLRPLKYEPEASNPTQGVYGCGAHTDYGMLTILWTDGNPGLQLHLEGEWRDMPPLPEALNVNLGDMLERWTNGLYRSTLHRVVNPRGAERYSTPFFFEPNFDTQVEALPSCCGPDSPPKYPPTTSGQHLLEKYAQTHAGYNVGGGAAEAAAA